MSVCFCVMGIIYNLAKRIFFNIVYGTLLFDVLALVVSFKLQILWTLELRERILINIKNRKSKILNVKMKILLNTTVLTLA